MNQLQLECKQEEQILEEILRQTEESLQNAPEGGLWVSEHENNTVFLQTFVPDNDKERIRKEKSPREKSPKEKSPREKSPKEKSHKEGRYIPKANREQVQKLAQKEYDILIKKAAETELRRLRKFEKHYLPNVIESIYENLHPVRKQLVTPVIPTIEQYISEWMEITSYFPIDFSEKDKIEALRKRRPRPIYEKSSALFTEQGDAVDSKTEAIISEKMDRLQIPYKYGCALFLKGYNGWVYPDFVALNKRTRKTWIWEHHGKMGDEKYAGSNVAKLEQYEFSGYWPGENLITTYETAGHQLNTKLIDEIIKKYLL